MKNNKATFLGKGWSFPPSFNKHTKSVETIVEIENIEKSLEIIISTEVGERVMHPLFGCSLRDKVFERLNSTQKTDIKKRIEKSILLYEPRIKLAAVNLILEEVLEGKLLISLEYIIKSTNSRRNIVFPFYLNEATDVF